MSLGPSKSAIRDRVRLLRLPVKDPSSLYLTDPPEFKQAMQRAIAQAEPWPNYYAKYVAEESKHAWALCGELAQYPDILKIFVSDLLAAGVVGEERNAKIIFLAVVSRLLKRLISIVVKGPSGGGKSHAIETVLKFFPENAFYALSAMSDKSLAYSDEPLSHRILVIYEAAGMAGDFATYFMRSLLSEGRIRYETVEKTRDGLKPKLIEREGPTGLITTTTLTSLHPENETRLLSLHVKDTPEQTKAVFQCTAKHPSDPQVDFSRWHALQTWLEHGERRVVIPFAEKLAGMIPPVAVRQRRDFRQLLILIEAHALLHRAMRKVDADGRIIAEPKDYTAIFDLVNDIFSEGVEASVKASTRETVGAVKRLIDEGKPHVSIQIIAARLKLDKGPVSRRVREAIGGGYLINEQIKRGMPAQIKLGDPLPDDIQVLPDPEDLDRCCSVAVETEGILSLKKSMG